MFGKLDDEPTIAEKRAEVDANKEPAPASDTVATGNL